MSALFDDQPILRVAALAGIRVALTALSRVHIIPAEGHTAVPTARQGKKRKKAGVAHVPDELYQAIRNCLEDSSMTVRLATVRYAHLCSVWECLNRGVGYPCASPVSDVPAIATLNRTVQKGTLACRLLHRMKFPECSKLLPVLHRLISIATPLQWVPLPIAECQAASMTAPTQAACNTNCNSDNPPVHHPADCEAAGCIACCEPDAQVLLQPSEEVSGSGAAQTAPTLDNTESVATQPGHVENSAECNSDTQEHAQGQQATSLEQRRMLDAENCASTLRAQHRVGEKPNLVEDHSQQEAYSACSTCVMQVLRTLCTLAVCNAEHMHEAVPLIMNSKCGFTAPNMGPLRELLGPIEHVMEQKRHGLAFCDIASVPSDPCEADMNQVQLNCNEGKQVEPTAGGADDSKPRVEQSAVPDAGAQDDVPQGAMSGASEVSIDVLKSAIEQGGWALVPEDQGSAACAQKGLPTVTTAPGPCSEGMYRNAILF